MAQRISERFLIIYSGLLTVAFALTSVNVLARSKKTRIDELEVQRIDVVEPDGTIRLVISNKASAPGIIVRNKEYPHPAGRRTAGLIFFNDEGTENGGLIFSGHKGPDGKVAESGGSLTFDKYEQDQIVQVIGEEDAAGTVAGLVVNDRPDRPILQDVQELEKLKSKPGNDLEKVIRERSNSGYYGANRVRIGRNVQGAAELSLADAKGHPRIVLSVDPGGASSLKFLDERGNVLETLTPTSKK